MLQRGQAVPPPPNSEDDDSQENFWDYDKEFSKRDQKQLLNELLYQFIPSS